MQVKDRPMVHLATRWWILQMFKFVQSKLWNASWGGSSKDKWRWIHVIIDCYRGYISIIAIVISNYTGVKAPRVHPPSCWKTSIAMAKMCHNHHVMFCSKKVRNLVGMAIGVAFVSEVPRVTGLAFQILQTSGWRMEGLSENKTYGHWLYLVVHPT